MNPSTMAEQSDIHDYSPAEVAAMRYAYRQLLGDNPELYPDMSDKQQLARSVIKSLENIRLMPTQDISEVVALIMDVDDG